MRTAYKHRTGDLQRTVIRQSNSGRIKFILTVVVMTIFMSDLISQNADQKWALGLSAGKTSYTGDLGNGIFKWAPFYFHGAVQLNRYLSHSFDLSLQLEHGAYGFDSDMAKSFLSAKTGSSLLLRYKLNNGYILGEDLVIAPYIAYGFGLAVYSGDVNRTDTEGLDAIMPLGGGLKINITRRIAFQYQVLYNFTSGDNRDLDASSDGNDHFLSHALGLVISFGYPKDSDGDGVPDRFDNCPETPIGVIVAIDGCPQDRDGDGVPDFVDKCPSVPGLAAFSGCPDRDGDGIEDAVDQCPDVRGLPTLLGCPDRDGDGVRDSDDRCPDVKGLPVYEGCPDSIGGSVVNISFSGRKADCIMKYLAERGIEPAALIP
jgi:OOP family OmpA-OmpF porin